MRKLSKDITVFKITDDILVECRTKHNYEGFKHTAKLKINKLLVQTASIQYYNRTWESFTYESVLKRLYENNKHLNKKQLKIFKKLIENGGEAEMESLNRIGALTKMSALFGDTKKEKNERKLNALKIQLGDTLMLPDDFNELSEEEKERRLDNVINVLSQK